MDPAAHYGVRVATANGGAIGTHPRPRTDEGLRDHNHRRRGGGIKNKVPDPTSEVPEHVPACSGSN